MAESLLFENHGAASLALATDALTRLEKLGGQPIVIALLHRMRGLALVQTGARDEGVAEIEAGLSVAREGDVDYEVALAMRELARLGVGEIADVTREYRAIFERLGVERAPEVPLPAPVR
jgi:hypothetical protein